MNSVLITSILITGCNRGIGLGLVKYLSENHQQIKHIFATCRNAEKAQELRSLAENSPNIKILQADVKEESNIKSLAKQIANITGENGLDVLVNNAGISSRFTRLSLVKGSDLEEHFKVNTIGPILMAKEFQPLLKKSKKGVIINMSSILASIQENTDGGFYPYRTSKAALNAATRSMSIDLKSDNIIVVSLHPGWIKTDMGGKNAPLTVDNAVVDIYKFIANVTRQHSGQFYAYNGKPIAW